MGDVFHFLGRNVRMKALAAVLLALLVGAPAKGAGTFPVPLPLMTRHVVVADSDLVPSVDRHAYLRALFRRLTAGATTDQARIETFVRFVQREMFHPLYPPLDRDGMAVYDPIWLLEHRVGQCGQTNRVLVDAFLAAGYRSRLIQLNGHVGAEVFFGGGWHYVDADAINGFVRDARGNIPSAIAIYHDPALLRGMVVNAEALTYPPEVVAHMPNAGRLPFASYFEPWTDPTTGLAIPFAYVKTATVAEERNKYFGWNYYRAISIR